MRTCSLAAAFCLAFASWLSAAPAVSPSDPSALGPKETLTSWNFEDKTLEQVLPWYEANTDAEKKLANACAVQAIATADLAKVVRAKWGHDVESKITHLCLTETPEDDKAAAITMFGDRAMLKFDVPGLDVPLLLIQVKGVWKVDMAAYVRAFFADLDSANKFCELAAEVARKLAADISADKYATSDDAIDALKRALAPLQPNQK